MIQELKTHTVAYTVLAAALLAFTIIFLHLWPDHFKQQVAVVFMGIFYVLWGVVVHSKTGLINTFVVLEYLSIAVLFCSGMILLAS